MSLMTSGPLHLGGHFQGGQAVVGAFDVAGEIFLAQQPLEKFKILGVVLSDEKLIGLHGLPCLCRAPGAGCR